MHDFFGSEQKKAFWKLKQKIIYDMVIFDDLGNWKMLEFQAGFWNFTLFEGCLIDTTTTLIWFEMQYLDIKQLTSICYKYTCIFQKNNVLNLILKIKFKWSNC